MFTDASDGSTADNNFFNIGEQVSSGTITATGDSGQTFSTTIGPSGGYSLQIPPGTYVVSAHGGELTADYIVENVVLGSQNVKVDFETTTASVLNDDMPQDPDPEEEEPAPAFAQRFDFGTRTSPLEPGYTRVTASTSYNATLGYGWAGGAVRELDRGTGTGVTRDLHYRDVGTFVVDVPNGTYQVTLTVGDTGPYRHDQQIILEGVPVDSIATAARQVVTRTYAVTVSDGQLTLRLDGRGGADPNMVISGLQVTGEATEALCRHQLWI